ncbi:S-layer family protein, partial [Aquitalea sp. ASV15]|uniref:beta strand repeat-containing protein n=1 Tax=Aquitalea sp. ASV15 TaxID=2795104 RepID=UPI0018EC3E23
HVVTTTATVAANGSWTVPASSLSGLVDGAVTVKASVSDVAGNPASASNTDSKDTVATIAISSDGSGSDHVYNSSESGAVVVSGSTTGVEAGQTVTVTFTDSQGHTATSSATVDGSGNWTASPANLSGLSDGSISVSSSVSDKAGNTANASVAEGKTATLPDAPVVGFLSNGLTSQYYNVNDGKISSPPSGSTSLSVVQADLQTLKAAATFIATNLNYGDVGGVWHGTTEFSNNLGTTGNLSTFLGGNATNLQLNSNYTTTTQSIIQMNGAFSAAAGTYYLNVNADDGYQIKIDGQIVSSMTGIQSQNAAPASVTLAATAGNLHTIEILYWDQGGNAVFQAALSNQQLGNTTTSGVQTISLTTNNTLTATVTLDSTDQTDLSKGGAVTISSNTGTNVTLHLSGNNLVDSSGTVYTYQNGVIYLPVVEPSTGQTLTVTATVSDVYGNVSNPGSGSYALPSTPPVSIVADTNHDGYLNAAEVTAAGSTISSTVQLDPALISAGGSASIVVVDAGTTTTLQVGSGGTVTGAANNVSGSYNATTGLLTLTMNAPGDGKAVSVTATQTDHYGISSSNGTAAATEDISGPSAPTVVIATDANNDGYINRAEQGSATTDTVNIGLPSNAKAGDTLNVTINGVVQSGHVLTAAEISAGKVVLTPATPADGSTLTVTASVSDPAGNTSASVSDSAKIDLTATIAISSDGSGSDGVYNKSESTAAVVSGTTTGVEAGQTVTVTFTDSANHVVTATTTVGANGTWTIPASTLSTLVDGAVTVKASVSDVAGNTATASNVDQLLTATPHDPSITPAAYGTSTGLTWQQWNGTVSMPYNGGNGTTPANVVSTLDSTTVKPTATTTISSMSTVSSNVSTENVTTANGKGIADKVSGLIYLEAGHTYSFSGAEDDSFSLNVGGTVVGTATWGAGGSFSGSYTPTASGWYTIAAYHDNEAGPGAFNLNVSVDGATAVTLDTSHFGLVTSVSDLTNAGLTVGSLVGSGGQGYYVQTSGAYNISLDSVSQTVLSNGGSVHVTTSAGTDVSLHLSNGTLTDGSHTYSYANGVIGVPVAISSGAVTVSATLLDSAGNSSHTMNETVVTSATPAALSDLSGVDTFRFELSFNGAAGTGSAHNETINNFNATSVTPTGTVSTLDLRDLLVGESHSGTAVGNLANYLHVTTSTVSGVTTSVLHVSETGQYTTNSNGTALDTAQITLNGVDLTAGHTLTSDAQILQNLLGNGKLITD